MRLPRWLLAFVLLAPAASSSGADDPLPAALLQMAEAERAFSTLAGASSIASAFVTFFADEAVSFAPDPGPARPRLREQPPSPPGVRMAWEPRVGDVAASGDLGYLTGPVEISAPGRPVRYSNYFSVWKRQSNGDFRVILDIGAPQPAKPAFADGLVRSSARSTYSGQDSRPDADASLLAADRTFSAAIATSAPTAYANAMHVDARLHRPGVLSMATRSEASAWLRSNVAAMTSAPHKAETAGSRDLGYTWGAYTMTSRSQTRENGYYVRVWTRRGDGSWQLVADVVEPSR